MQSLGGVIGGEATGCTEATTEVFIEAALFDPVRTAATGRQLNIASDARYRFERGLDPAFVGDGLEIATRLMLELCGGEASEVVDRRRRAGMAAALRAARRAPGEPRRSRRAAERKRRDPRAPSAARSSRSQRRSVGRAALLARRHRGRGRSRRGGAAGQGLRPDPGGAAAARHAVAAPGADRRRGAAPNWCAAPSPRAG